SRFLNSFIFDCRGCVALSNRHAGIRFIIPSGRVSRPTRIMCKLLRETKVSSAPVLCEGEGHVCRVLKLSTDTVPMIIEVPHFGSLKNHEREIVVMKSFDGNNWTEHSFTLDYKSAEEFRIIYTDLESAENIFESSIVQICTLDVPAYLALISRPKKNTKDIGQDGGVIMSSVVPKVKVTFPEGAITKTTSVGVQVTKVIPDDLAEDDEHHSNSFSSIVSIEPRCRKFHKDIKIEMPLPDFVSFVNEAEEKKYKNNLKLFCNLMGKFIF
ncbi:hypothetical protein HELRODRAFT_65654, partial [Helobdella robusta]|uniref:ZU5 domain-containing protein n=1 Tax=Helobdella robusta TaxID=6412 RepID=T1FYB2_HELRO